MSTAAADLTITSDYFARQVRARLSIDGTSFRAFAVRMGVPEQWTGRRLGPNATVAITLDAAQAIADALDVPLAELLPPAPSL